MKAKNLKQLIFSISILASAAFSSLVSAHSIDFEPLGQSGNANGSVDVFTVNCPSPSAKLEVNVTDFDADNFFVTATLLKTGAASALDPEGGDFNGGPFASLSNGTGVYTMIVNHTGTGQQTYSLQYHCRTAGGTEVDPVPNGSSDFTRIQDQ